MTVLADLSKPVPEFPDRTIITRRSFLMKERNNLKRFMQGLSEAIYQIRTADDRKREELIAIAGKHLRVNLTAAREFYDLYENAFSFPPRVGRNGMAAVIDLMEETGRPKAEFEPSRLLTRASSMSSTRRASSKIGVGVYAKIRIRLFSRWGSHLPAEEEKEVSHAS
jgi:hypothetical protein